MTQPDHQAPPKSIVFWAIWFAILSGLFVLDQFAAPQSDPSEIVTTNAPVIYPLIGLCLGLASLAIRFMIIPKMHGIQTKLTAMIIGLAVAESAGIIGMFVVPTEFESTRTLMLVIAIICVALHAPIYSRGLDTSSNNTKPTA